MPAKRWFPHPDPTFRICFRLDVPHVLIGRPEKATKWRLDSPLFHLVEFVQVKTGDTDENIDPFALNKPTHEDARPGGCQFLIISRSQVALVLANWREPMFPSRHTDV